MSESFGLFKGLKVTFKELFRKSVTDFLNNSLKVTFNPLNNPKLSLII